jgi:hypothetical protein
MLAPKEHEMSARFNFPEPPKVAGSVPLFATIAPEWTAKLVGEFGARLDVRGRVEDGGTWYLVQGEGVTLEVYQASHSFRLSHAAFDSEGSEGAAPPDADRALATAQAFHERLEPIQAEAEVHSVTELAVSLAQRDAGDPDRRVVGLQVNHRYRLDGLPLLGPGAKAQVTVGAEGEVMQAYRFWREVKQVATRPTLQPAQAFERFAASQQFADLPDSAEVTVRTAELGLLCLPPTAVQGVLVPVYRLRGEVSTELLPHDGFVAYVAAVDLDESEAKRRRWSLARPALVTA